MRYQITPNDFKQLVDDADDGYMILDANGVYLYHNKSYLRVVGLDRDCVGDRMQEFLDRGDIERSGALMALEQRKTVTLLSEVRGKVIYVRSVPYFGAGGDVEKVYTHVKDITEVEELRKQIREMEESLDYAKMMAETPMEYGQNTVVYSKKMKEVFNLAKKISNVHSSVLLLGESGVGKDVVAQFIHRQSAVSNRPFIAVNCSTLSEQLLESELFGYMGGSFTGASKGGKKGLFEAADGGVLFLDEIGDVSPKLQVKLLRVLETKTITRVGDYRAVPVNVRIIAATNKDLEQMVQEKEFREDLYYRLNVISIQIPPLCERREDIQPLALFYLSYYNRLYNTSKRLSKEVMQELRRYSWPGNVRELKNAVERLVVTSEQDEISAEEFHCTWGASKRLDDSESGIHLTVNHPVPLEEAVAQLEKAVLQKAWDELKTSRRIAEVLKVDRATVSRKLKKYRIGPE